MILFLFFFFSFWSLNTTRILFFFFFLSSLFCFKFFFIIFWFYVFSFIIEKFSFYILFSLAFLADNSEKSLEFFLILFFFYFIFFQHFCLFSTDYNITLKRLYTTTKGKKASLVPEFFLLNEEVKKKKNCFRHESFSFSTSCFYIEKNETFRLFKDSFSCALWFSIFFLLSFFFVCATR